MATKSESAPAANLPCEQCGYENEAERVYCHNCGAKLNRSLLPKEAEKSGKNETSEQARKRIAKMTNPKTGGGAREIKTAVNVLIYSAILAALFLITQKPDGVPEVNREILDRSVGGDLLDALDSPQPRRVDFTEAEINSHLQQLVKSKDGDMFKRAYVNLLPDEIRIGSEQSLFDLSLYSGVRYRLEVREGKFTATLIGGNFGRLAVHPLAMQYLDYFFQKLWTALGRERRQMDSMQKVVVQKGTIAFVTKGAAAP